MKIHTRSSGNFFAHVCPQEHSVAPAVKLIQRLCYSPITLLLLLFGESLTFTQVRTWTRGALQHTHNRPPFQTAQPLRPSQIKTYCVWIRLALIYNAKCPIFFGHKMKIPTIVSVRISEMEMKSVCTFLPAQINHVELTKGQ